MLSLSKHEATTRSSHTSGFMGAYVYMLQCADGLFYVGSTRASLEKRIGEHNAGTFSGFTKPRRPVKLVYSQEFDRITDAIAAERRLKGWSRAKKLALIAGDYEALKELARNRTDFPHPPAFAEAKPLRLRAGRSTGSG